MLPRLKAYLDSFQSQGGESALEAYFEGRVLEVEGRHREAAAKYEEVLVLDRSSPLPYLHLAESLRAQGKTRSAEQRLREALQRDFDRPSDFLLNLWFTIFRW